MEVLLHVGEENVPGGQTAEQTTGQTGEMGPNQRTKITSILHFRDGMLDCRSVRHRRTFDRAEASGEHPWDRCSATCLNQFPFFLMSSAARHLKGEVQEEKVAVEEVPQQRSTGGNLPLSPLETIPPLTSAVAIVAFGSSSARIWRGPEKQVVSQATQNHSSFGLTRR